jgi:hypothetical protein
MRSDGDNAVYNARIPYMRVLPSRFSLVTYFLVLMWMHVPTTMAEDWRTPEERLARKIVAVTGPGTVALDTVNRSSLTRADVEAIRSGLLAELATLGVRPAGADQAAATIQITFSENLQSFVWVAEIQLGNNEKSVVMVTAAKPNQAAVSQPAAVLQIRKTLLWTDENRILDVALVNGTSQHMIVLEPESVVILKFQDGRWQPELSLAVAHSRPWPRDLRGRLALRNDHLFDAYLPGIFCRSTTTPLAINCYESDDPWPLGTTQSGLSAFFAQKRNFFTGALSPGIDKQTTVPAFYSAAMVPRDKYKLWIFAAVDGSIHLMDGITNQTATKLKWGSDIASIRSSCGLGWQLLVTGSGENGETISAFEIADREPIAVSQPTGFSAAVTALWSDSDGTGAIAVSQDPETEKYEAYRLSVSCGQ